MKKRSKIIALLAVLLLAAGLFCGCGGGAPRDENVITDGEEPQNEEKETDDGYLHVVKGRRAYFNIVYSERADRDTVELAETLGQRIFEETGTELRVKSDYVSRVEDISEETPEILIGLTNRKSSIELNKEIGALKYAVKVTDTKVVIIGKNVDMLSMATEYFVENYVKSGASSVSGDLSIKKNTLYVSEPAEENIRNLMSDKLTFGSSGTLLTEIDGELQGGCVVGDCYYALVRADEIDKEVWRFPSYVVKYSLRDMSVLKISGNFLVGNGSDMNYDAAKDLIMIAHGMPEAQTVSYIGARELRFSHEEDIIFDTPSIVYLGSGKYAAIDINGGDLVFLNSYLRETLRCEIAVSEALSMAADERYIYILGKVNGENAIAVYNRSGDFINSVALDFTELEPRNIDVYNGNFVVGFVNGLQNGGEVYNVKIEIRE